MKNVNDPYGEEDWDETNELKEFVDNVKECKLVYTGYEADGHDCWGNTDWNSYKYVIIDGKQEKCYDGWVVIHDGEKVKKLTTRYAYEIDKMEKINLSKTGFKTDAEYKAYLKGKDDAFRIATQRLKEKRDH